METEKTLIQEALALLAQPNASTETTQEARILLYEALGCTRSDAQGIVDAEDMTNLTR